MRGEEPGRVNERRGWKGRGGSTGEVVSRVRGRGEQGRGEKRRGRENKNGGSRKFQEREQLGIDKGKEKESENIPFSPRLIKTKKFMLHIMDIICKTSWTQIIVCTISTFPACSNKGGLLATITSNMVVPQTCENSNAINVI